MNHRQFLSTTAALGLSSFAYGGLKFWSESGFNNPCLFGSPQALQQHQLMKTIWADIDASQIWDSNVHLVGTGVI